MSSAVFGGGGSVAIGRSFDQQRLPRGRYKEIVEEPTESPAPTEFPAPREEETEKDKEMYVALDMKEGSENLNWVLQNTSIETKIVLVHVHLPPRRIPSELGGMFSPNHASEGKVAAQKIIERKVIEQHLDEYINMCAHVKVKRARKLVIEDDDVGKGLVELITQYGITELVMGAAEHRTLFHRKIRGPTSKAALTVQEQADPSCNVTFVYKGRLICRRPRSKCAHLAECFSEFSYSQLKHATRDFAESSKIGEGGYGSVYKGLLHRREVAIKLLKPQGVQGKREFEQEVNVLSKLRHPHLVTLIGACPEMYSLVYEFLPSGSLEDRLTRKNNTPPLTWQERCRIASEICSSLVFLHTNESHCIVHGDLKPDNILLDANLVSKLGDFGLCRLLVQSLSTITVFHCTDQAKGTPGYMDPELMTLKEITAKSDVYSFGVILLRLLTGKSPFWIATKGHMALEQGSIDGIIDPSAGNWPYEQAVQLAALGVKCCEIERKKRPRSWEVLQALENLIKPAPSKGPSSSKGSSSRERNRCIPDYLICPLRKEIMRSPYIAADGITYEAEAIKGWLERGHDTSPMTGLKLPHLVLFPNHAISSAIQKWRHEHI